VCLTLLIGAAPAAAVTERGQLYHCRLRATKLGDQITVTFTVNAQFPRHEWRIRIWHGNELVYHKVRRTNAEGNTKAVTVVDDRPGPDRFEAKARDLTDGAPSCAVDLVA
jgi:hypothetical protein